ncbi:LCP family protein [Anaerotignum lactatifermentans]|uniref:LCP family protein n=1 Tax=Anaerotignum lactatifermentans TaxID=160404 RepID=A0ABS2G947_9FIRM|nr:LCP family protein [Anaerotignum lactatifermentans]MBM6828697.1 LCP family protein [Anaerotignum lactatifermentans]MBM6877024.1 LCP family protein [Anaerotignum lactatifermentans]MBM6950279.1 LCP family protein [Anaerotignum lactatifermentans]
MKENRTDQRHRRRAQVHPDYERERKYAEKMRRRQQEYSRQEWIEQERYAQQHRLGTRMQRNRIKQMEMRRKRRRGEILLCVALVLILAATFAAAKIYTKLDLWQQKAEKPDFVATAAQSSEVEDEILNIAIFGTDGDGFRTDVNIVASFHVKTKELHLISVPRDTRVTMTDEMISYLEKNGKYVPDKTGVYGQCKMTEVHAYAGEGNRCAFSVAMLEEILGIDIDYYVKINLDAFKEIVDAVGGVTFNVEERLYYSDPAQGLYIDLYPGEQVLHGDEAEMLVRFRSGYAQGDLKRIQVQQDFMKAFIEQVCSTKSILDNLDSLIRIGLEKTETNMPLSTALQYAKYVTQIDPATVTTDTIPGEGGSYFDMDEEATKELIDYRIYDIEPPADETEDGALTETTDMTETTNG